MAKQKFRDNWLALSGLIVATVFTVIAFNARAGNTNSPSFASSTKPIPYPLATCVVSGDTLGGDMGPPIEFVYQGQEVKFCCPDCKPKFIKNPDKYMKIIHDAEAKAKARDTNN
jgi:hypothetical protein